MTPRQKNREKKKPNFRDFQMVIKEVYLSRYQKMKIKIKIKIFNAFLFSYFWIPLRLSMLYWYENGVQRTTVNFVILSWFGDQLNGGTAPSLKKIAIGIEWTRINTDKDKRYALSNLKNLTEIWRFVVIHAKALPGSVHSRINKCDCGKFIYTGRIAPNMKK